MSRSTYRRAAFLLAATLLAACDSTPPSPPGQLVVHLVLTGLDADADGFQIQVDDGDPWPVPTAVSTFTFQNLAPGTHTVRLSELAASCTPDGENPRPVRISSGATEQITVTVTCTALTATLEAAAPTSGLDLDPDGYQVRVDNDPPRALSAGGLLEVEGLPAGNHDVRLDGVAANCAISSENPQTLKLTTGGRTRNVERATFDVRCSATTGVVLIQTVTTGVDQDRDGYQAEVDDGPPYGVARNGSVAVSAVGPGTHSVRLDHVATNCHIEGDNPRTALVAAGGMTRDTARVTFTTSCVASPRNVQVTVLDPSELFSDRGYAVTVDRVCDPYIGFCTQLFSTGLRANASVIFDLPAGAHLFELFGQDEWCAPTEGNPQAGVVKPGEVLKVTFTLACPPSGAIRVTAPTTGEDPDGNYTLQIGPSSYASLSFPGEAIIRRPAGSYELRLLDVSPNCAVNGLNPQTITVVLDEVATAVFPVVCQQNPTLKVTVITTGPNQPNGYLVGVDPYYYYGYYGYTADVGANGEASIRVSPGEHWVYLDGLPANCSLTSPNGLKIEAALGGTTTVAFAVVCR